GRRAGRGGGWPAAPRAGSDADPWPHPASGRPARGREAPLRGERGAAGRRPAGGGRPPASAGRAGGGAPGRLRPPKDCRRPGAPRPPSPLGTGGRSGSRGSGHLLARGLELPAGLGDALGHAGLGGLAVGARVVLLLVPDLAVDLKHAIVVLQHVVRDRTGEGVLRVG